MNLKERINMMRAILNNELIPITEKKGHDYSGDQDSLSNLRDFGWGGVVVRIGDKYHRLKNFCVLSDGLKVQDESIEDTLKDLINYGFIALLMYREEKKNDNKNCIN